MALIVRWTSFRFLSSKDEPDIILVIYFALHPRSSQQAF